jgi:adenylate cyclase
MADTARIIADITRWLLADGKRIEGTGSFEEALIERLRRAGLPIDRFTTGVPSLHLQVDSFSSLWEHGKDLIFRQYRAADIEAPRLSNSPIFIAYETGKTVRRDLCAPPEPGEATILPDLRADGYTDYLVIPIPFSDGSNKAFSFATKQAGGFSVDDVLILDGVRDALAAVIEIRYLGHMAGTLMDTYVGPVAGRRVLAGQIKRGEGDKIKAVIWFCDLRGFTQLAQELGDDGVIEALNAYFGAMGQAVEDHGGEILKFIGDAMLAIFPLGQRGGSAVAASKALDATRTAQIAMEVVNSERAKANQPALRFGIALHPGEVTYGNIGAADRLDFTVIGAAVNLASRIEGLCGTLGRKVLVSADFVHAHGGSFDEVGHFLLKGVEREQTVYAPTGDLA